MKATLIAIALMITVTAAWAGGGGFASPLGPPQAAPFIGEAEAGGNGVNVPQIGGANLIRATALEWAFLGLFAIAVCGVVAFAPGVKDLLKDLPDAWKRFRGFRE